MATTYDPESELEKPVELPAWPLTHLAPGVELQRPLSHRGRGPGLVLLLPPDAPIFEPEKGAPISDLPCLEPRPIQKFAEESFAVLAIEYSGNSAPSVPQYINALKTIPQREGAHIGLVGKFHPLVDEVNAVVTFFAPQSSLCTATLLHSSDPSSASKNSLNGSDKSYRYDVNSPYFTISTHPHFNHSQASVAHSRSLSFLKQRLSGPYFDLEKIWDEHTYWEFEKRSVARTMATMVAEPYVNHIPTLTGGVGREDLTAFYRDRFIFSNPPDTKLNLVSRTVGIDRVVDEFVFELTHTKTVDWLHEHINWDHATLLCQLGLLPSHVPFSGATIATANGVGPKEDGSLVRLPVIDGRGANKLLEPDSEPSNEMFGADWGLSV
ncbi:hypothetical protein OIO90_003876 [Microbotryomycetes sp. JL221]|nr:hypothetical protein OIO90_003876 [Microbotryomycetes sp. JL221]